MPRSARRKAALAASLALVGEQLALSEARLQEVLAEQPPTEPPPAPPQQPPPGPPPTARDAAPQSPGGGGADSQPQPPVQPQPQPSPPQQQPPQLQLQLQTPPAPAPVPAAPAPAPVPVVPVLNLEPEERPASERLRGAVDDGPRLRVPNPAPLVTRKLEFALDALREGAKTADALQQAVSAKLAAAAPLELTPVDGTAPAPAPAPAPAAPLPPAEFEDPTAVFAATEAAADVDLLTLCGVLRALGVVVDSVQKPPLPLPLLPLPLPLPVAPVAVPAAAPATNPAPPKPDGLPDEALLLAAQGELDAVQARWGDAAAQQAAAWLWRAAQTLPLGPEQFAAAEEGRVSAEPAAVARGLHAWAWHRSQAWAGSPLGAAAARQRAAQSSADEALAAQAAAAAAAFDSGLRQLQLNEAQLSVLDDMDSLAAKYARVVSQHQRCRSDEEDMLRELCRRTGSRLRHGRVRTGETPTLLSLGRMPLCSHNRATPEERPAASPSAARKRPRSGSDGSPRGSPRGSARGRAWSVGGGAAAFNPPMQRPAPPKAGKKGGPGAVAAAAAAAATAAAGVPELSLASRARTWAWVRQQFAPVGAARNEAEAAAKAATLSRNIVAPDWHDVRQRSPAQQAAHEARLAREAAAGPLEEDLSDEAFAVLHERVIRDWRAKVNSMSGHRALLQKRHSSSELTEYELPPPPPGTPRAARAPRTPVSHKRARR